MPLSMAAAFGHAEVPSNDGWFHSTSTGTARLTLSGPADEVHAVGQELMDRGLIGDRVITTFHDGPGEQSCMA